MMQVFEHKNYLRTVEPRVWFTVGLDGSQEKKKKETKCKQQKNYTNFDTKISWQKLYTATTMGVMYTER